MLKLLKYTTNDSRYQENLKVRPSLKSDLLINKKELDNLINKNDELRVLLDKSKTGGVVKNFILSHINRMGETCSAKPHKKFLESEPASCCGILLDKKTNLPSSPAYDSVNKTCKIINAMQIEVERKILNPEIDKDTGLIPVIPDYGYLTMGFINPLSLFILCGVSVTIIFSHFKKFNCFPPFYYSSINK